MKDTPETDAYVAKLAHDWVLDFGAFDLLLTHARELERERDAARKIADAAMWEADRLRPRPAHPDSCE